MIKPTELQKDTMRRVTRISRCTPRRLADHAGITHDAAIMRLARLYHLGWAERAEGDFMRDKATPTGGRLPWIYSLTEAGAKALRMQAVKQNKPRRQRQGSPSMAARTATLAAVAHGRTTREIAGTLGLTAPAAHCRLGRLEARGFVAMGKRRGKRGGLWKLTKAGRDELARLQGESDA